MNALTAITARQILSLRSPQFWMRYPTVINDALISPAALRGMDPVWSIDKFVERDITFTRYSNVYCVEEGLLFDGSGELIPSTKTQHSPAEVERAKEALDRAMAMQSYDFLDGTYVLCKKRGARNYGHWLCEMLPKAFLAKTQLAVEGLRYLTPELKGGLGTVIADSLTEINILPHRVTGIGSDVHHVENVIVVDGLTSHGQFMSPLVMDCLDFVSLRTQGSGLEKIFVSRTSSKTRRFTNETEILDRAVANGYVVINPGEMDLAEQIAAFKNASSIVGTMGAEMTNIAFAPRGCRATLLAPAAMSDTFFWFLAGLRGMPYREIRCAHSGPSLGNAPWDTDLVLNPHDLDGLFT